MCYTVAVLEKRADRIADHYRQIGLALELPETVKAKYQPYYFLSGFSYPQLPIIAEGEFRMAYWGLIPFWIKDPTAAAEIRMKTLNAVGETVFQKPSFRNCIVSRRCILPITGFYEWRAYTPAGGKAAKYPYFIHRKEYQIISLGCIYDEWTHPDTGEVITSFSIITRPANPLLSEIHNTKLRMPMILSDSSLGPWLDRSTGKEGVREILEITANEDLRAFTVSKKANSTREERNVPEILEPVEYVELPSLASIDT